MDDFSTSSLSESKNEWCARLLNVLTPTIVQGLKSIFDEAWKLCKDNNELDKYLMTFQNFLTRVPKWNQTIIDTEKTRIIETSGCHYLEDIVTCVHIIQLKALTCIRVGSKQKKIDINIPSISDFIHKIYIHVARKIYTNIYLFEKNIEPLQIQKNNREIEVLIQECILNAIRDSIPLESILRAYMDETEEQDVEVSEVVEPLADEPCAPTPAPTPASTPTPSPKTTTISNNEPSPDKGSPSIKDVIPEYKQTTSFMKEYIDSGNEKNKLSFSDNDSYIDTNGNTGIINAPKNKINFQDLEKPTETNYQDEEEDYEGGYNSERLVIGDTIKLDILDVNDLNKAATKINLNPPVLDFEVLI